MAILKCVNLLVISTIADEYRRCGRAERSFLFWRFLLIDMYTRRSDLLNIQFQRIFRLFFIRLKNLFSGSDSSRIEQIFQSKTNFSEVFNSRWIRNFIRRNRRTQGIFHSFHSKESGGWAVNVFLLNSMLILLSNLIAYTQHHPLYLFYFETFHSSLFCI